ncbi:hypothetical protein Tco_1292370 [Tanacetum coccineum]
MEKNGFVYNYEDDRGAVVDGLESARVSRWHCRTVNFYIEGGSAEARTQLIEDEDEINYKTDISPGTLGRIISQYLADIVVLTGGTVIRDEVGLTLEIAGSEVSAYCIFGSIYAGISAWMEPVNFKAGWMFGCAAKVNFEWCLGGCKRHFLDMDVVLCFVVV